MDNYSTYICVAGILRLMITFSGAFSENVSYERHFR